MSLKIQREIRPLRVSSVNVCRRLHLSLIHILSSGELDVDEIKENSEQTVKDYDFARPSKFSKEHLRTLEIIFEHYGRLLTTNLPVYLRKSVQVEVMNSEAVTYSEFTNALSNPVLLGSVNFAPLQGNIIAVSYTHLDVYKRQELVSAV